jgi:nitroimidazol reductase NimA-like FMN-containing flavoprotein (pyridoxamine 5'-phosphate oxidase superfamily)
VTDATELAAAAKAILDANRYMTLATADESGMPWASPVWYASEDYREFFWVSAPGARHSRNLAGRPQVGIVIFDSQVPGGAGQAVYISATAEEVAGAEIDAGVEIFSRRSEEQGLRVWTSDQVRAPARHRLYRAVASEHFVLSPRDERLAVSL